MSLDFEILARQMRQVEADLSKAHDDEEVENLLKRQRQLGQRVCVRCGRGFSLLFNRRLECGDCGLGVCRKCSSWIQDPVPSWRCVGCQGENEFREHSCQWFYTHLQKRLNNFGSTKIIKSAGYGDAPDSSTTQVREHIESLVESLVGKNLDEAKVIQLFDHPSYHELFSKYHQPLKESLTQLSKAIYAVIRNEPVTNPDLTPISAHTSLKQVVDSLVQHVISDPSLNDIKQLLSPDLSSIQSKSPKASLKSPFKKLDDVSQTTFSNSENQDGCGDVLNKNFKSIKDNNRNKYNSNEMYLAESYEDILSTAIINKVVTTKRSSLTRSPRKSNNSSHSPFNDDEEDDGKTRYAKDIENRLNSDNVVGNGDVTNMNVSQNEYDNHSKNTALRCYDYKETWKERRNGGLKYNPEGDNDCFDPDIIPIKTKNIPCDHTGVKDSFKELSLPTCTVSSFPPHMSSKSFIGDRYKDDEDTNTMSSVSRMSECFTDTSYTRRTSSNYSASDGTHTTCTSDDQSDDNMRYTIREEIEEVITTEEFLNEKQEGSATQSNDSNIKISSVQKPKFTVTSHTIDPPIDRFRDSLYCLDSPNSSVASSPPGTSHVLSNDSYNFCDENLEIKSSNKSVKVPFPEFGVDLILASPRKRNSFIDPQEIDNLNCDAENHNDVNNLSANANDNITFVKNDVYDTNQSSFRGKEDYDNNYPDDEELPHTTRLYLADSGEWEDNWLFQRSRFDKNLKMPISSFMSSPFSISDASVCMLVPNPNKDMEYKPTIGNVDIDLVSELSERISVASLDYYSSSDSSSDSSTLSTKSNDWEFHEPGEFPSLDGGQQNDLEYTEFSVLPHRKNSFTGLVSGGTIERTKVKKKQKEIVDSITKLSSSTDAKKDSLYFVRQPPSVTNAVQGNQVTFQCQIRGQKPIDVVWFRGSTWNLLEDTEKFDIEISQRKECHFITLFNVNASHSGKYSCMAVNAKQEIWHEFMLNVKNVTNSSLVDTSSSPKIEEIYQIKGQETNEKTRMNDETMRENATSGKDEEQPKEFIIQEFEMVHLLCKISQGTFPEPRLLFYNKQGKRMQNNENVQIEKKSTTEWALTFRRCTIKDDGCYIVKAINNIGSDAKSWKILVVAAKPNNMLVLPCNDLPEGNQSGSINKNSEQSDDSNTLSKLGEITNSFPNCGSDNLNIESSPHPTATASSCENVLDKDRSAKEPQFENMPLYPHSILKKGSNSTSAYPQYVTEEPVIDYDTEDEDVPENDGSRTKKSEASLNTISNEDPSLDRPAAKPGTIADREHRKWTEKAIPLQNNPYTKESIEKRLQRISGDASSGRSQKPVLGHDSNVEKGASGNKVKSGRDVIVDDNEPRRIDCGLKTVDPSLYRRDYYVNSNGRNRNTFDGSEIGSSARSDGGSSNASDDGNYSTSSGSASRRSSSYSSSPEMSRSSSTKHSTTRCSEQSFKQQKWLKEHDRNDRNSKDFSSSAKESRNYVSSRSEQTPVSQDSKTTVPFQKSQSHEKPHPLQGKFASKNRYAAKNTLKTSQYGGSISSSIEKLHDSLEDSAAIDSGLGSSCEYKTKGSKVETEILRFQREIEKSETERSRIKDWERRKFSRSHNCSMDSLLSFDSDASCSYSPNTKQPIKNKGCLKMPPKGKFSSTTSLLTNVQKQILLKNDETRQQQKLNNEALETSSTPPALPPKLSNASSKPSIISKSSNQGFTEKTDSHKHNSSKRRVSISTDAVEIIGHSSFEGDLKEEWNEKGHCEKENEKKNMKKRDSDNLEKKGNLLLQHRENPGRMSVPDIIPFHELNDVACMQNQVKENSKPSLKKPGLSFDQKKNKERSIYGSNKDLEDLTEKGLPSVKDLVNKFLPNRTASVDLYQNPEPSPRQSILQKAQSLRQETYPTDDPETLEQSIDSLEIHSLTARSVPRHFREGLKHNLPSPTDKNIKIPQPNVQAVPFPEAKQYRKKISTDSKSSVTDGSQEDYLNYRRLKVTTSSWGKKEESESQPQNDDNLVIIYDSATANTKKSANSICDGEDPRTSSPEHLGIPSGPVRMPLQRKFSIQNTASKKAKASKIDNEESLDEDLAKSDKILKKYEGKTTELQFSKDNDPRANAYTSDDSCVDSVPPSRVRHPPSNRRKITKSSAN